MQEKKKKKNSDLNKARQRWDGTKEKEQKKRSWSIKKKDEKKAFISYTVNNESLRRST